LNFISWLFNVGNVEASCHKHFVVVSREKNDAAYQRLVLLLLLKTFVKRKNRINTQNAVSQQLNRNVFSLALKTSSEMSGDLSSVGKLFQTTGPLTAKLLFP